MRMGARIFPEARDSGGTPFNQQRRAKRMVRRQIRRRRERRRALNEALAASGLLPSFSNPEWAVIMAQDPYGLRMTGLCEPLPAYSVGRALYHLAKRRHFKTKEIEPEDENTEEAPDEKAAKSNRDQTLKSIATAGTTLGAWLAKRPENEKRRAKREANAIRSY